MKKKVFLAATLLGLSLLTACGSQKKAESSASGDSSAAGSSEAGSSAAAATGDKVITVGASPSPHAEILEVAKDALKAEGYELKVVEYTDYVQPNLALESKSLDANYFQHLPYLENFNKERGTKLVSVAAIHYEPFGIYAGKSKDLKSLPEGAKIAVPNDVTNEARALLLLADQGLITLKDNTDINATKQDIVENPHNIEIVEVEAAQVPRSLQDVDFGVVNGNFAIASGLKVADALATEAADSVAAKTYANIVVVREGDENSEKTQALVKALTTAEIKQFIENKYQGAVVPIF
ncbi:MetQ/NlpA family ABC transporter substrate-binding protein [Stomatobaculum longum]|uniref:MetQ/NlpA family ABC transporter substrate-binding protein n=1 Tax=Stomatobaculum longum TaxID=796942 RepID=UPI0028D8C375|nr:MetQ/NlpA family ABC transporter substrate-binding protein [Stomatobaculum longum]